MPARKQKLPLLPLEEQFRNALDLYSFGVLEDDADTIALGREQLTRLFENAIQDHN